LRSEEQMREFQDRRDAGKKLAYELVRYTGRTDVIVLALPRGGVPVAYEVARALNVPLDIFVVRKLGLPGQDELAIGAIAPDGIRVLNDEIIHALHIPEEVIEQVAQRELQELQRREHDYRGDQRALEVRARTVILIDDGLATGASMRAAVVGLRARRAARIIVAVPVAAQETYEAIRFQADEIVCVTIPEPFYGVSQAYDDFSQTLDDEVRMLFDEANRQLLHG
jgi:putative phosphoribosyl transferase